LINLTQMIKIKIYLRTIGIDIPSLVYIISQKRREDEHCKILCLKYILDLYKVGPILVDTSQPWSLSRLRLGIRNKGIIKNTEGNTFVKNLIRLVQAKIKPP
jgi:hypothetical protein